MNQSDKIDQIAKRIAQQPVGRAVLIINDVCGMPSVYLPKINAVAGKHPELIKALAITCQASDNPSSYQPKLRSIIDARYNRIQNLIQ